MGDKQRIISNADGKENSGLQHQCNICYPIHLAIFFPDNIYP
jgi:hypothetical protein